MLAGSWATLEAALAYIVNFKEAQVLTLGMHFRSKTHKNMTYLAEGGKAMLA